MQHLPGYFIIINNQHSGPLQHWQRRWAWWLRRQTKRQSEPKSRAFSQLTADANAASHEGRQLLANGQTQAGAAKTAGGGSVGLDEAFKHPFQLFLGDTDACVLNGKF